MEAVVLLDRIRAFVSSFRLFAPTIEECANPVEVDKTIDAVECGIEEIVGWV